MRNASYILLLLVTLTACSNYSKTSSGLAYQIFSSGDLTKPVSGQYLIMDVLVANSNDSVLFDSKVAGIPVNYRYDEYAMNLRKTTQFEEGILLLNKGDSGVFNINSTELYFMKMVTDDHRLTCNVKLLDIFDYEQYSEWKSQVLEKRNALHKMEATRKLEIENKTIDSLLKAQNIDHMVTDGGMRYHVENSGIGSHPTMGDSVSFTYEVTYLNGTFLPNELGTSGVAPKSFVLGSKDVFEIWQESIQQLNTGGSGTFYYPSTRAFGQSEAYGIKPNAILQAKIKLISIH